ncbi:hypothetical protein EV424DRAFT_1546080 [Suillus variegatus]|nr:hypothetical protein EV424DRAFT_1546080 [Suillus variegatus]
MSFSIHQLFELHITTFVASKKQETWSTAVCNSPKAWNFAKAFEGWEPAGTEVSLSTGGSSSVSTTLLKGFEDKAAQERKSCYRQMAPVLPNSSPLSNDLSTVPFESSIAAQDE